MTAEEDGSYGPVFWVAVALALVAFAVGMSTVLDRGVSTLGEVAGVVVATDLVHDLVLLPVVAALAVLLRRVPPLARAPIGAALGWTLVVGIVSVPLVGAFGRTPNNRSVLPLDYSTAVPTALATGWLICGIWFGITLLHARWNVSGQQRMQRSRSERGTSPP